MRIARQAVVVLLFGFTPGASWAFASQPPETPRHQAQRTAEGAIESLDQLWSLFASAWSKAGCVIDPWGHCEPSAPTADEGCGIDPWGGCASSH